MEPFLSKENRELLNEIMMGFEEPKYVTAKDVRNAMRNHSENEYTNAEIVDIYVYCLLCETDEEKRDI